MTVPRGGQLHGSTAAFPAPAHSRQHARTGSVLPATDSLQAEQNSVQQLPGDQQVALDAAAGEQAAPPAAAAAAQATPAAQGVPPTPPLAEQQHEQDHSAELPRPEEAATARRELFPAGSAAAGPAAVREQSGVLAAQPAASAAADAAGLQPAAEQKAMDRKEQQPAATSSAEDGEQAVQSQADGVAAGLAVTAGTVAAGAAELTGAGGAATRQNTVCSCTCSCLPPASDGPACCFRLG